jgi:hypothetical protein
MSYVVFDDPTTEGRIEGVVRKGQRCDNALSNGEGVLGHLGDIRPAHEGGQESSSEYAGSQIGM